MSEFLELFEKGDFVEFGKKFNKIKRKEEKSKEANKIYEEFKPKAKSENFFGLDEWELNKLAFAVAVKSVVAGLAMSQIRKILGMSNAIYRKSKRGRDISADIVKLNYILAYTMGRQRRGEIEPIAEILSKALAMLKDRNSMDYERIHSFLQAVVAYHKLLGGRD